MCYHICHIALLSIQALACFGFCFAAYAVNFLFPYVFPPSSSLSCSCSCFFFFSSFSFLLLIVPDSFLTLSLIFFPFFLPSRYCYSNLIAWPPLFIFFGLQVKLKLWNWITRDIEGVLVENDPTLAGARISSVTERNFSKSLLNVNSNANTDSVQYWTTVHFEDHERSQIKELVLKLHWNDQGESVGRKSAKAACMRANEFV